MGTLAGLLGQPEERKTMLRVALRLALSDAAERLQRRRPQHQRVRFLSLEPLEHVLRTKHQRGGSVCMVAAVTAAGVSTHIA